MLKISLSFNFVTEIFGIIKVELYLCGVIIKLNIKIMTTTSTYNRSEIMKEAWSLYRSNYGTFSNCLKAAWRGAKFDMKQAMMVAKREAERMARYAANMEETKKYTAEMIMIESMSSLYANGVYSGD